MRFIAALCTAALPAIAAADIITLNPTTDAFVSAAAPSNNYGAAGGLAIAAAGLPNGEFQTVLRFDTTSAVAALNASYGLGNWTITAVSLRLTATAPNNPIFNAQAAGLFAVSWMQNDSWTEGTGTPGSPTTTGITFNSLPAFLSPADEPLGIFAFAGATSGAATYALSLAPAFSADLAAGGPVGLRLYAADPAIAYVFNSVNVGSTANRPVLTITAIPEPAAAVLLLLAARRPRRR